LISQLFSGNDGSPSFSSNPNKSPPKGGFGRKKSHGIPTQGSSLVLVAIKPTGVVGILKSAVPGIIGL
jgi:hypothetical protein